MAIFSLFSVRVWLLRTTFEMFDGWKVGGGGIEISENQGFQLSRNVRDLLHCATYQLDGQEFANLPRSLVSLRALYDRC